MRNLKLVKTVYGNNSVLDEERKLRIASNVSNLLSIRNPNREKFAIALENLIKRYEKRA